MSALSESNAYEGYFGDLRLSKRGMKLEQALVKEQSCVLRQLAQNRNEEVSYGRFLSNERTAESSLISSIVGRNEDLYRGKHVLSIQDSTEFHYHPHADRIRDSTGLGDVGRSPLGYFMHPSLIVDSSGGELYGLSDIHLYHRDPARQEDTSTRKYRAVEEKESYKWIASSQRSKAVLDSAAQITIIQDRDADMYESFARIPDEKTHLLIRSKTDRNTDTGKLYKELPGQVPCGKYTLEVTAENKKRQKRQAQMEIRYTVAKVQRPKNLKSSYPPYIRLTVVQAKELPHSVPVDEDPIEWILLTTHEVQSFSDALQIVVWYSFRWFIEDLFRLLKNEGFRLEESELETGQALRKLGIMTLHAATRIMQLRQARQESCQLPIQVAFDEQEQACLQALERELEGRTEKLKNPYDSDSLPWAAWIIARLGGWSGYQSQRPAGVITLKRGLERFELFYWGWSHKNQHKSQPPDT